MKKQLTILILLMSVITTGAIAQSWQWGKRGGSAEGSGSAGTEPVVDMATDQNGNVYVLANTKSYMLNVDGHALTSYGSSDIVLSSFDCEGNYRWSKVIGGYTTDLGKAIGVDTLGGVYLAARVSSTNSLGYAHISTDSALGFTYKKLALIKYDTAGVFQWLRMPESDTMTSTSYHANNTSFIDMVVSKDGTQYVRGGLAAGLYENGYLVDTISIHIWKYDKDGDFLGGFPLQTDSYGGLMVRNPENGRFILSGKNNGGTIKVGTDSITHGMYVVCFDSAGNYLWKRESEGLYGGLRGRPALDDSGQIFVAGGCGNGISFMGYACVNYYSANSGPFVAALDNEGALLWANMGSTNAGTDAGSVITTDKVFVAGSYPLKLKWNNSTDSFSLPINNGYNVFLTSFAKSGNYVKTDTLTSGFGASEHPTAMAKDHKGNIYVGGEFEANLYVAGDTLNSHGGYSDFFVVKYGYANCNCTMPAPLFTFSGSSGAAISFSYTGSTDLDSLHWDFGDGSSSNATNPTHTYATSGSYNVCLTAYNACGSNTVCQMVTASVSVGSVAALFPGVKIYPNPASQSITIEGAGSGTRLSLYSITGALQLEQTLSSTLPVSINIGHLPDGVYLLQFTDGRGRKGMTKVVKR